MSEWYQLKTKGETWHVMVHKSAGAATEAVWISLGGCPSQLVSLRVYLGLIGRGGG